MELSKDLCKYLNDSKDIYILGCSGIGKTTMIKTYLDDTLYHLNYLSIQNISNMNDIYKYTNDSILNIMNKTKKTNIVIIDDIDILNNNEKKILNELIKKLKVYKKKESKQFKFIFIGINQYDKKVKELMKLCNVIHLKDNKNNYEKNIQLNIKNVIEQKIKINSFVENEKATQCLMFHENVINNLKKEDASFYLQFLNHYCSGDYYDRVSFQKQLWIYNEMTYYLKMIHNYYVYKNSNIRIKSQKEDYRFTKVLTKYSNEYNNQKFIIDLCNRLNVSKKQLFTMNHELSYNETIRLEKYLSNYG